MQDGNVCCKVEIFRVHREQQPACTADELDLPSLIKTFIKEGLTPPYPVVWHPALFALASGVH